MREGASQSAGSLLNWVGISPFWESSLGEPGIVRFIICKLLKAIGLSPDGIFVSFLAHTSDYTVQYFSNCNYFKIILVFGIENCLNNAQPPLKTEC